MCLRETRSVLSVRPQVIKNSTLIISNILLHLQGAKLYRMIVIYKCYIWVYDSILSWNNVKVRLNKQNMKRLQIDAILLYIAVLAKCCMGIWDLLHHKTKIFLVSWKYDFYSTDWITLFVRWFQEIVIPLIKN